jgi:deoxyribose-phosphate aldolase
MKITVAASYFDHTLLKQSATRTEVAKLCTEAIEHGFFSVCVNPYWIPLCRQILTDSQVKTCTVVGFPLGANLTKTKIQETEHALEAGAQEIDCVINVGALKSGHLSVITDELEGIVSACRTKALVKVIVESGLLNNEQLMLAIQIVSDSGAEYIKTSTGFANVGATPEAVKMMKKFGRDGLKIKVSGGVRSAEDFKNYVALGADRIGASRSVEILKELSFRS